LVLGGADVADIYHFASWLVNPIFCLSPDTKIGDALHFFVEDTSKIFGS